MWKFSIRDVKYAFELLGVIIRSSLNELRDFKSLIVMWNDFDLQITIISSPKRLTSSMFCP